MHLGCFLTTREREALLVPLALRSPSDQRDLYKSIRHWIYLGILVSLRGPGGRSLEMSKVSIRKGREPPQHRWKGKGDRQLTHNICPEILTLFLHSDNPNHSSCFWETLPVTSLFMSKRVGIRNWYIISYILLC